MDAPQMMRALNAARVRLDLRRNKMALRLCLPSDQAQMAAQLDAINAFDQKLRRAVRVVTLVVENRGRQSQYPFYEREALEALEALEGVEV